MFLDGASPEGVIEPMICVCMRAWHGARHVYLSSPVDRRRSTAAWVIKPVGLDMKSLVEIYSRKFLKREFDKIGPEQAREVHSSSFRVLC